MPDFDKFSLFIMKLFGFLTQDYYLILDRTNWKWGKKNIKKLLIVPVTAFCWSYRTGEWQPDLVKPITVKKHLRSRFAVADCGANRSPDLMPGDRFAIGDARSPVT
ncbi:MAG: hypothetical protein IPL59_25620 [Candidatus Competibacteraceae bacterium]|nr:hypothetical protein [Candidatus Competibacteraceae bacterium]